VGGTVGRGEARGRSRRGKMKGMEGWRGVGVEGKVEGGVRAVK
jgi:hypothetical protein